MINVRYRILIIGIIINNTNTKRQCERDTGDDAKVIIL